MTEKIGFGRLFLASLGLFLFSWHKYSHNYRLVDETLPATHAEPRQAPLEGPVADQECCKGPYCWRFTPLYNYEVTAYAFGTSHKLASKFDDVMSADVGLLWGENSKAGLYKDVTLRVFGDHYTVRWSGDSRFNLHEAANTHLAACGDGAFAAAKAVRPGDQVRLRGWLVNAVASEKPRETDPRKLLTWRTSQTRADTGEGSCEILYLRSAADVEILSRGPRRWYWLRWLGALGMAAAFLLWQRRLRERAAAIAAD